MKGITKGIALLGFAIAGPLWAHHAAEGIVSDDIWLSIDDNLQEADSPHLGIDFDDPGGMGMDASMSGGRAFLETTYNVNFLTEYAQLNPVDAINTYFDDAFLDTMDEMNRVPSGTLSSETSSVYYEVVAYIDEDQDGYFDYAVVNLFEPIGNGNSQTEDPEPAPGKRAGG